MPIAICLMASKAQINILLITKVKNFSLMRERERERERESIVAISYVSMERGYGLVPQIMLTIEPTMVNIF
jgi:hypothetical protein